MLDIELINNTIEQLEDDETNFYNCQKLASLYIVKDHYIKSSISNEEKELRDMLPAYQEYCEIKKKYQMRELPDEAVVRSMKELCQEIKEFLQMLFTGTDMPQERKQLRTLIDTLNKEWN